MQRQLEAIRAYEAAEAQPGSRPWQTLLTIAVGGILLGAGVLLFVAAHWDMLAPLARLLVVVSMLVLFHGIGLGTRERFSIFATATHALGTVSCGAAIALTGQIWASGIGKSHSTLVRARLCRSCLSTRVGRRIRCPSRSPHTCLVSRRCCLQ